METLPLLEIIGALIIAVMSIGVLLAMIDMYQAGVEERKHSAYLARQHAANLARIARR